MQVGNMDCRCHARGAGEIDDPLATEFLQVRPGDFHGGQTGTFGIGHVPPEITNDGKGSNGLVSTARFPECLHDEELAIKELDELIQQGADPGQAQKRKEQISQKHGKFVFQRTASFGHLTEVPKRFSKTSQTLRITGSRCCLKDLVMTFFDLFQLFFAKSGVFVFD